MIKEIVANTVEKNSEVHSASKNFNPDMRLDTKPNRGEVKTDKDLYDPDKRLEPVLDRDKIYTSTSVRIRWAGHSEGKWQGEVGNSTFIPSSPEAKKALEDYGQKGIKYKDGNPDFSKCSVETIQINDMSSNREKNFAIADKQIAEKWSAERRFDKNDWTRSDVRTWRHENKYSWHERLDKRTMDLVQRDVHDECKHFGGISECKRMENAGGVFNV